jgi:hypothetical protein
MSATRTFFGPLAAVNCERHRNGRTLRTFDTIVGNQQVSFCAASPYLLSTVNGRKASLV